MSQTVLQVCTDSARWVNLVAEYEQLSSEQLVTTLTLLNDMLNDFYEDGIELGWYTQTNPAATAPLQDSDIRPVKLCLANDIMVYYGLEETVSPNKMSLLRDAKEKLAKRTTEYFESDMSCLPIPQGAYWGGGVFGAGGF